VVNGLNEQYLQYVTRAEPEHFRAVLHEHWQEVWNYAYFLTGNRDTADDLTQDVFAKAYRHIASFRGEASVKTWLLRITRNTVINYRRSALFRKVRLFANVAAGGSAPSAEHEYFSQEHRSRVWDAVMKLPVKFREVLLLDARYELSNEQIAGLLGISVGTVKSRIHRARAKISQSLREEGADDE
jgi:RNA polymerase sigma-70 factor (ECF subfamily)